MDINWNNYRSVLRKLFFGQENWKLADKDSEIERLFFKFLLKLQERLKRLFNMKYISLSLSLSFKMFSGTHGDYLSVNDYLSSLNII